MPYKHRVVEGLAQLIDRYGGGGESPIMRAVWFGLKHEVPLILQALDSSEEAIRMIEDKLREVLDIKPVEEPTQVAVMELEVKVEEPQVIKETPAKRERRKAEEIAEAELIVEATEEEKSAEGN